jgi:hypothetical protein
MGVITTGSFAKALWPGVNAWYGKTYDSFADEWKMLYNVEKSTRAYEEDVVVSSFGLVPVKNEGAPITFDREIQGFTTRYVHSTYGLGFIVTKEMFEDDQYDIVGKRRAEGLAFSVKQTLNTQGAYMYNNAAVGFIGGDGVSLLNASHPSVVNAGTQRNLSTTTTVTEAGLEAACIAIMKLTNDRGLRINLIPQKLIVPPDLVFEAERILNSPLRQGTANNDLLALKETGKFPEGIKVNHYLTGTTSWYIGTNCPDGAKAFMRRAPSFDVDNDFDTENAKFKATFRVSFGFTDWRSLYGYSAT